MKTAELNKQALGNELANASKMIEKLKTQPSLSESPADWIKYIQTQETGADAAISNLLNSSDATATTRARAFVFRGDLYWNLANLPQLPGAETEANLRLPQSSDALLQKSFDAYSEVTKNPTYADQHEILDDAHLGLAAIAENRGDWKTAESEFNAVVNDPNSISVLVDQAKIGLLELPLLQKKLYVAPPSGIGPATMPVDTGLLGPIGPMPSTLQLPTTTPVPATSQPVLVPGSH